MSYNIGGMGYPDYGTSTSIEVVHTTDNGAMKNEDVSKNAAMIPPSFGNPSADTLNTGTYLTPNLVPALAATGNIGGGNIIFPPPTADAVYPATSTASTTSTVSTGFTDVTEDMYYADRSLGTLKIPSLGVSARIVQGTDSAALGKGILPLFSAGRSRKLTLVPIIQSIAQLEKNYGKEGAEIIQDNVQDTIFGGFAHQSQTAEALSKSLGSRTVMSGSVSIGKNDSNCSLQMMERPLMTPDELKSIPKGEFVVMKTGPHPMRARLRLFLEWGISFGEAYQTPDRGRRKVDYADRRELEQAIMLRFGRKQNEGDGMGIKVESSVRENREAPFGSRRAKAADIR